MPAEQPCCANCPYFCAPPEAPASLAGHDFNGKYRFGMCERFPAGVRKEPEDSCAEHPERVVVRPDVRVMAQLVGELRHLAHPVHEITPEQAAAKPGSTVTKKSKLWGH